MTHTDRPHKERAREAYPASESYRDQWALADGSVWELGPSVPFGRYYDFYRKLWAAKRSSPDYVNDLGSVSRRIFIAHGETSCIEERRY